MDAEETELLEQPTNAGSEAEVAESLVHDASSSVRGTIYQIGVAVMKCFEMSPGETLYFEKYGDVTIEGKQQVETKHYAKSLTDGSLNFWKTLHNWMQDGFDPTAYRSLILYTSQTFGSTGRISKWNSLNAEERLEIIRLLSIEFLEKDEERRKGKPKAKPSELARYIALIVDPAKREKLTQIVERFEIEADSPKLPDLHKWIKDRYLLGAMGPKRDDFLAALIGFVVRPDKVGGTWSITREEFEVKFQELSSVYAVGTLIFPKRQIRTSKMKSDDPVIAQHKDHRFVDKILEIEHGARVSEAVRDYLSAVNTLQKEFREYAVANDRTEDYTNTLLEVFEKKHRIACAKASDTIKDSQLFYDEFTAGAPLDFDGFDNTPIQFRNGLLHTQIDDATLNLQWKVEAI